MPPPKINEFYDINKFPKGFGLTVFGISMPYISSRQSPQICFDSDVEQIAKIQASGVGTCVVYSDGLYFNSDEPAIGLKKKFQRLMEEHKRGYKKLINKRIEVIPASFSFTTWGQLVLEIEDFSSQLKAIEEFYASNHTFQKYVAADIIQAERSVNEFSISYILEEVLVDFLIAKGQARLQNEYVQDRQQWILNCYHGKPHRAHVYFNQQNPLGITFETNRYQNCWYDMLNKKLYEFERFDIDSFDFASSSRFF